MSEVACILVVDDEPIVRESLMGWLTKAGHNVSAVEGGRCALELLAEKEFDLVFLDVRMPDLGGMEVLKQLKAHRPESIVVMITAFGSIESAVEAMKMGAADYILKPFDPEHLVLVVERCLRQKNITDENELLRERIGALSRYENLVGAAPCMQQLFALIEEVARVDSALLIQGETGTGKELAAKAVHARSSRRYGPFIPVNCGALAENLLESELFGHEAGSFTGAARTRKGLLEIAGGGTLFLDEIGEIPPKMQVDLLRVLEGKKFRRVGGGTDIRTDFRLISATHRDLPKEIARGRFRQDLYFRLNVIEIEVPPLRCRKEDIPLLARHFLERSRQETNKPILGLRDDVFRLLETYEWPGNVRELENAMERAVVLAKGHILTREDFAFLFRGSSPNTSLSLKQVERSHIVRILKRCGWNVSRAAEMLEINRSTLYNKIDAHRIEREK